MQYIPISFSAQIFWGKGQGRLHAPLLMPMQKATWELKLSVYLRYLLIILSVSMMYKTEIHQVVFIVTEIALGGLIAWLAGKLAYKYKITCH